MAAVASSSAVAIKSSASLKAAPLTKSVSSRKTAAKTPSRPVVCSAERKSLGERVQEASKIAAAIAASAIIATSASALTKDELSQLTYTQVKGTGIANTCSTIEGAGPIKLPAGNYKITKFCMEPTSFTVKDESPFKGGDTDFVKTKLMTRLTYTLDEIDADATVGGGGEFTFKELDGIDYAPTTVQLPGGERVPFLFTIKEFNAKGTLEKFAGEFAVPSYRGSTFLDPKGRGGATGYDNAVALPAGGRGDSEELERETNKSMAVLVGKAVFQTAVVNTATNELGGVFESIQPSDTDLGAKAPKDVKIQGVWYAQYEKV